MIYLILALLVVAILIICTFGFTYARFTYKEKPKAPDEYEEITDVALQLKDVTKIYGTDNNKVVALKNVSIHKQPLS